ncbi:MAG TPA: hypothetical protein PKB10_01920 [Tepidisphaeraceae bacterium]|nr:hypothetical protein [Tepidisphaeraceae bacterium]
MEKLKALELRVASVKAMRHVADVAQGTADQTTPARRYAAACTIVREKRHVDKEATRAKEKAPPDQRYDEDGQPECDCVNVLDMCHPSLSLEEKVRLYMQLRRHIYRGTERDPESGPKNEQAEQTRVDAELARLRRKLPASTLKDPRKFTAGPPRHKRRPFIRPQSRPTSRDPQIVAENDIHEQDVHAQDIEEHEAALAAEQAAQDATLAADQADQADEATEANRANEADRATEADHVTEADRATEAGQPSPIP